MPPPPPPRVDMIHVSAGARTCCHSAINAHDVYLCYVTGHLKAAVCTDARVWEFREKTQRREGRKKNDRTTTVMPPRSLAVFSQAGFLMVSGLFASARVGQRAKKQKQNKQKGEEEKKKTAGFGK